MDATPNRRQRRLPASEDALAELAVAYLERFPTTAARAALYLGRKTGEAVAEGLCSPSDAQAWVVAVVQRMKRARVLDDRRWAESRARVLHRRGRALRVIRRDLVTHGVEPELVEGALDALAEEHGDVELSAARALARRRRLGPFAQPHQRAELRERHLAVLARAGFSFTVARRVIDEPADDASPWTSLTPRDESQAAT
ncbi:MAG: hypothetical protein CVU56_08590 [Deltaproteobacteria bacterium HGW-Deltaproteobacteria-14]|jgi:regulatory protein|nr:MAG: hypothetical protein CVU56_08590 [Deltaproteobacteria bacterium HGW-Deltaproteobacteria-14]